MFSIIVVEMSIACNVCRKDDGRAIRAELTGANIIVVWERNIAMSMFACLSVFTHIAGTKLLYAITFLTLSYI